MSLKTDLHDRLWHAYERWHELRATGVTKHDLKMRGLREHGDINRYTRNIIFTTNTLHTYERILDRFIDANPQARRVEDLGKREFRAFMNREMARGLASKTLRTCGSALAKFGALTGQTQSFAGLAKKYATKIRASDARLPCRQTPPLEGLKKAVDLLAAWDVRHLARTGDPRAYALSARLQLETSGRSISVTARLTPESLMPDNQICLVGKGGRKDVFAISPDLHRDLREYFAVTPGPLSSHRGYQCAYARAMKAGGIPISGTHGARRASIQDFFSERILQLRGWGLSPEDARVRAAEDAVARLGHSRDRRDHQRWCLGE